MLSGTIRQIIGVDTGTAEIRIGIDNQILKAHVTIAAVEELGLAAGLDVYAMIKSVALGGSFGELTR